MRTFLLSLALLASSCAGTCSAVGGGSIGRGAIGSGSIGNGAIGGQQAAATCDPFGSPDLAFMGCNVDGSNNATLATNDPVCSWHDSGSLGVDATQGTGTACPTFVEGGGPNGTQDAVTFDGGDYLATGPGAFAALAQPNMISVVANGGASQGADEIVVDGASSTARHAVDFRAAGWAIGAPGFILSSSDNTSSNTWDAVVATFDGASGSLRVNGTIAATGSVGVHTPDGLTIGATYNFGALLTGSIADVLVYDTPPTATDVETYLATHHTSTFPVSP